MTMSDCKTIRTRFADLLFDPEQVPASVQTHLAQCESCARELRELQATLQVLDAWQTPEPSPYFLTRLDGRLREERADEPSGWLARQIAALRAGFAFGPGGRIRPVAAMSLTVLLLVGSGTYLGLTDWSHSSAQAPVQTAVVDDLQTLDSNAQLLDRLESLSDSDDGSQKTGNQ
jgi:predicted anti-sigma-YlaC factor YlaD